MIKRDNFFKISFLVIIGLFFVLVFVFSSQASNQGYHVESNNRSDKLLAGKNNITFSQEILVRDLINKNKNIEAVSYQESDGEVIGFVNVFGGIGRNFYISPEKSYEIIIKENSTLIF